MKEDAVDRKGLQVGAVDRKGLKVGARDDGNVEFAVCSDAGGRVEFPSLDLSLAETTLLGGQAAKKIS